MTASPPNIAASRNRRALLGCVATAFAGWAVVAALAIVLVPLALTGLITVISGTPSAALQATISDLGLAAAILIAGLALTTFTAALAFGDRILLRAAGARQILPLDQPRLSGIVDRIATAERIPVPILAIAPGASCGAFVTGTGADSVLCVSEGLLTLPDDQLAAVVAHELAHLEAGDARPMTVAAVLGRITPAGALVRRIAADPARDLAADRAAAAAMADSAPLRHALTSLDTDAGTRWRDERTLAITEFLPRNRRRRDRLWAGRVPTAAQRLAALPTALPAAPQQTDAEIAEITPPGAQRYSA